MCELDPQLGAYREASIEAGRYRDADSEPDYPMDPYGRSDFGAIAASGTEGLPDLLGNLQPWIKMEETRDVLNEALAYCQEKMWVEQMMGEERKDAAIVFLPGQTNIAHNEEFYDLRQTNKVVDPEKKIFDPDEWVVQGITKEKLGWDKPGQRKCAYIIGAIQHDSDFANFKQTALRLRKLGAERIIFLCPYLAWTRQDRADEERGQPETIEGIMEEISLRADGMAVMDAHSTEVARLALKFKLPFCSFSGWRYLFDELIEEGYSADNSVVVGPDLGRKSHSARMAEALGTDIVSLAKKREGEEDSAAFRPLTEEQIRVIKGKRVIIFDDVIASGGTLEKIRNLIGEYVESITVIASHALFIGDAIRTLSNPMFKKIVITDSRELAERPPIGKKFGIISCVPPINKFLRQDMIGSFNPWKDSYFKDVVTSV